MIKEIAHTHTHTHTQTDGEIYHVLGLEESLMWNDYIAQSNLQILCNPYQITFFIELEQKKIYNLYGNRKDSE